MERGRPCDIWNMVVTCWISLGDVGASSHCSPEGILHLSLNPLSLQRNVLGELGQKRQSWAQLRSNLKSDTTSSKKAKSQTAGSLLAVTESRKGKEEVQIDSMWCLCSKNWCLPRGSCWCRLRITHLGETGNFWCVKAALHWFQKGVRKASSAGGITSVPPHSCFLCKHYHLCFTEQETTTITCWTFHGEILSLFPTLSYL